MPHFTLIARPKRTPSIPPSLLLCGVHDLKVFPRLIVYRPIISLYSAILLFLFFCARRKIRTHSWYSSSNHDLTGKHLANSFLELSERTPDTKCTCRPSRSHASRRMLCNNLRACSLVFLAKITLTTDSFHFLQPRVRRYTFSKLQFRVFIK